MESEEDVTIEIEEGNLVPPPPSNSFLDWSVLFTLLVVSLLVILVIVLRKRSERFRRPERNPEWIESSEDPDESLEDIREKRIRSFNSRGMVSDSLSEGIEIVRMGEPDIMPLADRGLVKRQLRPRTEVPTSQPSVRSHQTSSLPPPKHRPASQEIQEVFLRSKPPPSTLSFCQDSQLPCIRPIESLDELNLWQQGQDPWNVSTVPLRVSDKYKQLREPKTLFCHDMMGGYHYDKYPQGHWESNNYCFFHWAYIDSFIYFSHRYCNNTG